MEATAYSSLKELIAAANSGEIDGDEIVWRGSDGSFIVGDNWDYGEAFAEYVEAGTLNEYATA